MAALLSAGIDVPVVMPCGEIHCKMPASHSKTYWLDVKLIPKELWLDGEEEMGTVGTRWFGSEMGFTLGTLLNF